MAKATSNIYLNKRETVSLRYIPLNTKRGEPEGLNHQRDRSFRVSEMVETMETWKLPCAGMDLKDCKWKLNGNYGNSSHTNCLQEKQNKQAGYLF